MYAPFLKGMYTQTRGFIHIIIIIIGITSLHETIILGA